MSGLLIALVVTGAAGVAIAWLAALALGRSRRLRGRTRNPELDAAADEVQRQIDEARLY